MTPDNLIVGVQGTVATIEQAFGVSLDNYRVDGVSFHSPTTSTRRSRPALNISSISGLDNLERFTAAKTDAIPAGGCVRRPTFRQAYNVPSADTASGQSIGFTLWGEPCHRATSRTTAPPT